MCHFIYRHTGVAWLATSGYYVVVKPLQILLIAVLAVTVRHVMHKMINRLVRHTTDDRGLGLPDPVLDRISLALREATGVMSERRRQRAEALGSALRSGASATIFAVAVMLILSVMGINLAPLLASAGIAGIAIGFGAQNLVKDFIAGMFTLLEDQFGIGDVVEIGEISGTVEAVGLRITTIRDTHGVIWYVRNGEITKVGNKSQGWSLVTVDIPVRFAGVEEAWDVVRAAAAELADDPQWSDDLIEPPEVLGVEQIAANGAVLRTTAKTTPQAQGPVARELRRRLTQALNRAGVAAQISAASTENDPDADSSAGSGAGGGPVKQV
jgi:small-conductance mechanosensitive channel